MYCPITLDYRGGYPSAHGEGRGHYGMSKYLGEYEAQLLKDSNMNIGLLRLHNVYGPFCNYDLKYAQVIPSLIYKSLMNSSKGKINTLGL